MHFREPFSIAYETVNKADVVMLELFDSTGVSGLGSAAPDPEVTGETVEGVQKALRERLSLDFFSLSLSDPSVYCEKIKQVFFDFPSAQAALETAIIHLAARLQKKNPQDFFGLNRISCKIAYTIGIKPIKETLVDVEKRINEGYETIKLKCGLDLKEDVKKAIEVRKLVPQTHKLVLDANQGYELDEAKNFLEQIGNLNISAIEQPIAASDKKGLKSLTESRIVPILADEAASTPEEAIRLMDENFADGVNVKLMKYGGPLSCRKVVEHAINSSKLVMLGCMYESNVSVTATAYLARAYPVQFVDLDSGHLDFEDDPTGGGAIVKFGVMNIDGIPFLKQRN
jgi:L-alanine-DL-glutamate epimerase-like enolase superfamily enzyme